MRCWMLICVSSAAAVALLAAPAGAITFDDGMVHVIDAGNSFPFENMFVMDGPGASVTTVEVVAGGDVGTGLPNGNLNAQGNSVVTMSGGEIGGNLNAFGSGHVSLSGGVVGGAFRGSNPSTIEMSGGTATFVDADHLSSVSVTGGIVLSLVIASDDARIRIFGGSFGDSQSSTGGILSTGSAHIEIFGGSFGDLGDSDFLAILESQIIIHGFGFNFPFGDITASSGTLTGVLADGTPLSVNFGRASTATITLACPGLGFFSPTTPTLAADQDNYCEDWSGVMQPGDDLSRSNLELVDLSLADLSSTLLVGADLAFADLTGADLSGADVTGTVLFRALYDDSTLFPSGDTYQIPPWGLDGGITPWDAGMVPVPEPSAGLLLLFGAAWLAGLASMKGGA